MPRYIQIRTGPKVAPRLRAMPTGLIAAALAYAFAEAGAPITPLKRLSISRTSHSDEPFRIRDIQLHDP